MSAEPGVLFVACFVVRGRAVTYSERFTARATEGELQGLVQGIRGSGGRAS